jgi:hypothetical protein
MRATCQSKCLHLNSYINLVIFFKEHKLLSFSLYTFIYPPFISFSFGPSILPSYCSQIPPTPRYHSFIHSSMALQPFVEPWPLLLFRNIFYTDGKTPWEGDQPLARSLPTHRATQTQNKSSQTTMPWEEFDPTIPMLERAKTVHVLDHAATVIGLRNHKRRNFHSWHVLVIISLKEINNDSVYLYEWKEEEMSVMFVRIIMERRQ